MNPFELEVETRDKTSTKNIIVHWHLTNLILIQLYIASKMNLLKIVSLQNVDLIKVHL